MEEVGASPRLSNTSSPSLISESRFFNLSDKVHSSTRRNVLLRTGLPSEWEPVSLLVAHASTSTNGIRDDSVEHRRPLLDRANSTTASETPSSRILVRWAWIGSLLRSGIHAIFSWNSLSLNTTWPFDAPPHIFSRRNEKRTPLRSVAHSNSEETGSHFGRFYFSPEPHIAFCPICVHPFEEYALNPILLFTSFFQTFIVQQC